MVAHNYPEAVKNEGVIRDDLDRIFNYTWENTLPLENKLVDNYVKHSGNSENFAEFMGHFFNKRKIKVELQEQLEQLQIKKERKVKKQSYKILHRDRRIDKIEDLNDQIKEQIKLIEGHDDNLKNALKEDVNLKNAFHKLIFGLFVPHKLYNEQGHVDLTGNSEHQDYLKDLRMELYDNDKKKPINQIIGDRKLLKPNHLYTLNKEEYVLDKRIHKIEKILEKLWERMRKEIYVNQPKVAGGYRKVAFFDAATMVSENFRTFGDLEIYINKNINSPVDVPTAVKVETGVISGDGEMESEVIQAFPSDAVIASPIIDRVPTETVHADARVLGGGNKKRRTRKPKKYNKKSKKHHKKHSLQKNPKQKKKQTRRKQ